MIGGIHSPTKMMARGIKIKHILTIMLTSGQIVILVNLIYQIEQNDDMWNSSTTLDGATWLKIGTF